MQKYTTAKHNLFEKLKNKGVFYSYHKDITLKGINDKLFVEHLFKYGDFDDIKQAFKIYKIDFLKFVWIERLSDDKRFIKLNLMLARVFFDLDIESYHLKRRENARTTKLKMFASQN